MYKKLLAAAFAATLMTGPVWAGETVVWESPTTDYSTVDGGAIDALLGQGVYPNTGTAPDGVLSPAGNTVTVDTENSAFGGNVYGGVGYDPAATNPAAIDATDNAVTITGSNDVNVNGGGTEFEPNSGSVVGG
ncbi:MAG: hypothetical protein LIQ30_00665 [Planctomycetes bacterium]|nr:hypothetical protein [Planctomycetota bacterium]